MERTGVILTRDELDQILQEARAEQPKEACGFILRQEREITLRTAEHDILLRRVGDPVPFKHVPARNIHRTPETAFTVDPHTMLRVFKEECVGGWGVHAVYHTHPNREATCRMSPEDRRGAKAFLHASHYVIVALPMPDFWEAAAYRLDLDQHAWAMVGCAIGTFEAHWLDQPASMPLVVFDEP